MISDSDVPSFFFCVTFLTKEVPRIFLLTKAPVKLHKKVCCFGVNKSQHDYHFVKRIVQTKKIKVLSLLRLLNFMSFHTYMTFFFSGT